MPYFIFWGRLACSIMLIFYFSQKNNAQTPASSTRTTELDALKADFSKIVFTLPLHPEISTPDPDTLPDVQFRQYDPARRRTIDWGTLGNLGNAARPLFFELPQKLGFDVGIHAYDLYRIEPENLKFYRNALSLSDLRYSRGLSQDDGEFTAKFARTFTGGLTLALDFRNINQLGAYRYQRSKHNAIAAGGWLPVGKRYDLFVIFAKNTSKQQENGGIRSMEDFVDDNLTLAGVTGIPILWADQEALSRHADWTFSITQHLKLLGKRSTDSSNNVAPLGRQLRLTHTVNWGRQSFKFADDKISFDTNFGIFKTDPRSIRHFLALKKLENTLLLTTFKTKNEGSIADEFSLGILHRWWYEIFQEPVTTRLDNFFFVGKLQIKPTSFLQVSADAKLGFFHNLGEYQMDGELQLLLGNLGKLRAGLRSQRYPPPLLAQQLWVSKRQVWQNDFQKPVENTLLAAFSLPKWHFEVTALTHLVNNFIYFDQHARAQQTTTPLQVAQVLLQQNLRWRSIHFDNTLSWQSSNRTDVLRLSQWFVKNSLYFSGKIFKNSMLLDAGFDFRTNQGFQIDGYQPVIWQFHLQDSFINSPAYPWLDAFLAFKVKNFRVLTRFENLSTLWQPTKAYFQTYRYPHQPSAFRLGIRWRFLDSNTPSERTGSGINQAPPRF